MQPRNSFPASAAESDTDCLRLQVRTAVVAMLEAWAGVLPLERVLTPLADAVAAPKASPEGKLAGLRWLATVLDNGRASKALVPAVKAAAIGVNDKAGDVREAGSSIMALLMEVRQRVCTAVELHGF